MAEYDPKLEILNAAAMHIIDARKEAATMLRRETARHRGLHKRLHADHGTGRPVRVRRIHRRWW
jgi:hypothetical protein